MRSKTRERRIETVQRKDIGVEETIRERWKRFRGRMWLWEVEGYSKELRILLRFRFKRKDI